MRFGQVCVEGFFAHLPDEIVTSAEIESRLKPVYDRLGLPEGRLELMTGIRERRFFPPGAKPGSVSAVTARMALERTGIPADKIGCLIHGSVCRDQLEPATACLVHHRAGLSPACQVFDVGNACLGLLNGALLIAQWIESGVIEAGLVVGTEDGRGLVGGDDRLAPG